MKDPTTESMIQNSRRTAPRRNRAKESPDRSEATEKVSKEIERAWTQYVYVGVVRAMGTKTDSVQEQVQKELREYGFETCIVKKMSDQFANVQLENRALGDPRGDRFQYYMSRMDYGDALRDKYGADILARLTIHEIRTTKDGLARGPERRYAFIIDSFMHPEEVKLFRAVYGSRFLLVAVTDNVERRVEHICDALRMNDPARRTLTPGLTKRYDKDQAEVWRARCDALMLREQRDATWANGIEDEAKDSLSFSRRGRLDVRSTFILADLFVDLSSRETSYAVIDRAFRLLFSDPHPTPTIDEIGMASAFVAQRASGNLARRVGAVIFTPEGDLVAFGFNEVPSPNGGPYFASYAWPDSSIKGGQYRPFRDGEFKYRDRLTNEEVEGVDPNDRAKLDMILDLLSQLRLAGLAISTNSEADTAGSDRELLDYLVTREPFQDSALLEVIEYSRSVHAEMHAISSCARRGVPVRGTTLYTTTFPCHECARHIVAAGIKRVVFLEPYPKSRVVELHQDSISVSQYTGPAAGGKDDKTSDGATADKVAFVPYIGIAPSRQEDLYRWKSRKYGVREGKVKEAGRSVEWSKSSVAIFRDEREGDVFYQALVLQSLDANESMVSNYVVEFVIENVASAGAAGRKDATPR